MVTNAIHWVVRKTQTTRTWQRRVLSMTNRSTASTSRTPPYRLSVSARRLAANGAVFVAHGVDAQAREQGCPRPERGAQRLEQPLVAKPTVGHHQDRDLTEDPRPGGEQPHCLGELALKDHRLAAYPDTAGTQGLPAQIAGKGPGQARPAVVDHLQEAHRNQRLRPRILALIGLGGRVEGVLTAKHLAPGLGVDGVVQGDQQASVGQPSVPM